MTPQERAAIWSELKLMSAQQKRTALTEMPAERLLHLYIERPVDPMLYQWVSNNRPDVVSLYLSLKMLAGWR